MRITLIHNPTAGDAEQPSAEDLLTLLRGAGYEAVYQSSEAADWEAALKEPGDFVVAAGGDGTARKVARRLVGRNIPMAVLPLGTANNISKSLGLAGIPLAQLVAGWAAGRRLRFDMGVVTGLRRSRYFIEGVGLGLFAEVMSELDANDNAELAALQAEEKVPYVWEKMRARLARYPVREIKATLDGRDVSGEYILLEAMNTAYVGPNLHLAPDADLGDGLLDVVLLSADERGALNAYLSGHAEAKAPSPQRVVQRGQHLQITWNGFDIHVDDKTWQGSTASATPSAVIDVKTGDATIEFLAPV